MKSAKELRKRQDEVLENSKTIGCLQKIASKIIVTSTEFYKKLYSRYNAKTAVEFLEKECQKMIDQFYRI